jgi:hypothetical protein
MVQENIILSPEKAFALLMASADEAFDILKERPTFHEDWIKKRTFSGTRTMVRQSPFMGIGGGVGRTCGGFWKFAVAYATKEGSPLSGLRDRCGFERYQDFHFSSAGDFYSGHKYPLVVAEIESNPAELKGELRGLWSIRCPLKVLIIEPLGEVLVKLNDYSDETNLSDTPDTLYFVVEIPNTPQPPSAWRTFCGQVQSETSRIVFRLWRGSDFLEDKLVT